tara:strand:- start:83 stop:205 length:123 start_codon:yes stop_codon:yes gene_type:complete
MKDLVQKSKTETKAEWLAFKAILGFVVVVNIVVVVLLALE